MFRDIKVRTKSVDSRPCLGLFGLTNSPDHYVLESKYIYNGLVCLLQILWKSTRERERETVVDLFVFVSWSAFGKLLLVFKKDVTENLSSNAKVIIVINSFRRKGNLIFVQNKACTGLPSLQI